MSQFDFPIFPRDFLLGAATAAYQIEGGTREEGRGTSIWDTFSHIPGKTYEGHTGDVASDHYHRWRADVELMAQLNLEAYRFSIAWPRVLPQGFGKINARGLDFYDNLVDALLNKGIKPFITLYHWDLPQALQDKGGWVNRDLIGYFTDYAVAVVKRLGDRVQHWITFNEPWVFTFMGHFTGEHAPGLHDLKAAVRATHHVLLAHGAADEAIRAYSAASPQVGITLNIPHSEPATDKNADIDAARRFDGYLNRWFLDPLFRGQYPKDMLEIFGDYLPKNGMEELHNLPKNLDFLGVNFYTRHLVKHQDNTPPINAVIYEPEGARYTEMGWEICSDAFYQTLMRVHRDYHPPAVYITENGAAFPDVLQDNTVNDEDRIAFLQEYTFAAHRAMQEGVPLKGYFVWSLLDNFEWAHGYSKRFGIVYVDYKTQKRIIKNSGYWYRDMIARR